MTNDYYRILGINRSANEDEIKRAFRKLAKQYHPDTNPNNPQAESRFKEINAAYEVLGDPQKRAQYDRFGANPFDGSSGFQPYDSQTAKAGYSGGSPNDFDSNNPNANNAWGDIFDSIFGGFGSKDKQRPNQGAVGRDLEHEVTITLREAHDGTLRYINKGQRRLKVNIPAGATNGTRVRLANEGEKGPGGPGDLYLIVKVEPDAQFERDGDDLLVELEIDLFTAILGGEVRVPTLARPVKLKIPPGTQSGQKLRISSKGMPRLRQKDLFGDLYAQVMVTVPKNLTATQRELLMQFKQSLDE